VETPVESIMVDPGEALVYEHGWQSWSPTAAYRLDQRPARPGSEARRVGNYRPERVAPADAFWGEGLLAVDPGTGEGVHVVAARSPGGDVPSLRADVDGARVTVTVAAGGEVDAVVAPAGLGLQQALAWWADGFAAAHRTGRIAPPPTVWCSWYHYFTKVTEADVLENLDAVDDLGLDVDVVQIDDGWQAEIGDWLTLSDRFRSLSAIVDRIRGSGRRAGIWVAPFFLGGRSTTLREHPDWVIGGAEPGEGWEQPLAALDVTQPEAEAHLREVFGSLAAAGIDYFKIDFLFAGAMEGRRADPSVPGVDAYRHGLAVIREAIGPDAYLLGCGAPQLPSVGLVDGMRIGPDIAHHVEPPDGDLSQPSQRAAAANARARAWMQGRFWVNDADCLVAGGHVERREDWADVVEQYSGLRSNSDRLAALDPWGLATTRRLLRRGIVEPFGG
jgi:alpha-galactosidase